MTVPLSVSLNLLHLERNKNVQNSINLMFKFGLIPTTNKPTRITKDTVSSIDHKFYNKPFKTVILKTNISDHFLII